MGLPTSRNITISPSDPIPSQLLNAFQDQIIGAKRPSMERWTNPSAPATVVGGNTLTADRYIFANAGTFTGMRCPDLDAGDRITDAKIRFLGTGSAVTSVFQLWLNKGDGTPVLQATFTLVNPPAAWTTYTATLASPHVMLSGESLYLTCTGTMVLNQALGPIGLVSDRL